MCFQKSCKRWGGRSMTKYTIDYGRDGVSLSAYRLSDSVVGRPKVLALHGFMGSGEDFRELAQKDQEYDWYAMDFLGHVPKGVKQYTLDRYLEHVDTVLDALDIEKCTLLGYSMGGRIALHYVLSRPERVEELILVGASPGIEEKTQREERRGLEMKWVQLIRELGVKGFIDYWQGLPIIVSQQNIEKGIREGMQERRLRNTEAGLVNHLLGLGTGVLPSLWGRLGQVRCQVRVVTGEKDVRFVEIGRRMVGLLSDGEHVVVPGAGHAAHLEGVGAFLDCMVRRPVGYKNLRA